MRGVLKEKFNVSLGEIRSTEKLQLVHSDLCGPMSTDSIGGKKYFLHLLTITHVAVLCIL